MAYTRVEAIPLMSQDQDQDNDDEAFALKSSLHHGDELSTKPSGARSLPTILLTSAFFVSLISLLYNAYAFSSALRTVNVSPVPRRIGVEGLRRPSMYLGLERVPGYQAKKHAMGMGESSAAQSGAKPLLPKGAPSAMARVNSKYVDVVFEQDGWVFLTEDDHMLMQFDVPPGATRCAFYGTFPRQWDLGVIAPTQLLTIERDDGVARNPQIQFTSLPSSSEPIDLASVSWTTLPAAGPVLGTLTAAFGTNDTTAAFDCPIEGNFVVEAACLGGQCRVEYTYPDLSDLKGPPGRKIIPALLGVALIKA